MSTTHAKKVFITGGTAGIGRATALHLAENGYEVFIIGRDENKAQELLHTARRKGIESGRIRYRLQDLTDVKMLKKALPEIWTNYGPFGVLINNAGLGFDEVVGANLEKMIYMIKTNLDAYLVLAGYFGDLMIKESIEGDIINIGSMSADTREAESSGYVATKAGIQGFTEALRKELNPHGIRVSLIEPGAVATGMQSPRPETLRPSVEKEKMLKANDIARVILYLLQQDRRISIVEMKIKPLRQII